MDTEEWEKKRNGSGNEKTIKINIKYSENYKEGYYDTQNTHAECNKN